MGVDLTIMPQSYRFDECIVTQHAIQFERDRTLFEAIEKSGQEVDAGMPVTCHFALTADGETCYGEVTENPYGTPITSMTAGQMHDVLSPHQMHGSNVWIFAALGAMHRDLHVYLYWH